MLPAICETRRRGVRRGQRTTLGPIFLRLIGKEPHRPQPTDHQEYSHRNLTPFKSLLINSGSIRDYTRIAFLIENLVDTKAKVAAIVETFLVNYECFFIKGYRIFRVNAETRRKRVALLISTRLNVKIQKLLADPAGRYLKLSLTDIPTRNITTISAAYLEPTASNEMGLIDPGVWCSDCILAASTSRHPH
jgi:hypothetical protein